MSDIRTDDLKTSKFDTWAKIEARRGAEVKTVQVKVDHKAATRQAIIVSVRRQHFEFKTRSDWHAKDPAKSPDQDWDYTAIAIHHAGNSFSCAANGADEMRKAEAIDMESFGQVSYHYAIDCMGVIYEALDIRYKGSHIEGGNTGVIGIVFLADWTVRGEAEKYGPGVGKVTEKRGVVAGIKEWIGVEKDQMAFGHDEPTERQLEAGDVLVKSLLEQFKIKKLGGHREFAKTHGTSRACPGAYGMAVASEMRKKFKLLEP